MNALIIVTIAILSLFYVRFRDKTSSSITPGQTNPLLSTPLDPMFSTPQTVPTQGLSGVTKSEPINLDPGLALSNSAVASATFAAISSGMTLKKSFGGNLVAINPEPTDPNQLEGIVVVQTPTGPKDFSIGIGLDMNDPAAVSTQLKLANDGMSKYPPDSPIYQHNQALVAILLEQQNQLGMAQTASQY